MNIDNLSRIFFMELYRIFLRILKDLGCYTIYKQNFLNMPRYIPRYDGMDFKNFVYALERKYGLETAFQRFINDSFEWAKTPQGHKFWSEIHNQFKYAGAVAFNRRRYVVNVSEDVLCLIKLYHNSKLKEKD